MNYKLTIDNLTKAIRESQSISNQKIITDHTTLEDDLGITGDDGCDLLEDIERQFSLSFSNQEGSFREVFSLEKLAGGLSLAIMLRFGLLI